MTLLRFQRASDGKDVGVLTWHAVHATSLLGNNTHAAGDNKGLAAWMLENELGEGDNVADGFVAGFSQANHADTSPNVLGAWCDDGSGEECDFQKSTCSDGTVDACHGRGPKFEALDLGVSSCYEIATRLTSAAKEAYVGKAWSVVWSGADNLTGFPGIIFINTDCGFFREVIPLLPQYEFLGLHPT